MTSSVGSSKVLLEPVFVIHSRPYRDTSLLVDFFSSNYGRVRAVARSARGAKSRFKGRCQSFVPLLASWSGRAELKTLNYLELHGLPYALGGQALMCGFYLNELLSRMLHREDAFPELFAYYQLTLQRLREGEAIAVSLRYFEKRLLQELGYGLPLKFDATSGQLLVGSGFYQYMFQQGFSLSASSVSAGSVSGASLLALRDENLSESGHLNEIRRMMREVLSHYLGSKPLKTRELLR